MTDMVMSIVVIVLLVFSGYGIASFWDDLREGETEARSDIPLLIAEIERLREENARMKAALYLDAQRPE